jgi:beta-hydroxylase
VCFYRGQTRFENVSEYLRKGWPIFAPFNCLLYILTPKKVLRPIIAAGQIEGLEEIKKNWQTIRDEAMGLYEKGYFDQTTDPNKAAFYDIGFRTFYKYGWSKFYLTWYGHKHNSALKHCPKTVEILSKVRAVNGSMFSLLPVGSQLTRHLDPVACSLRYHLGLRTPNADSCFINVDGNVHSWRDGQELLFDETFLHFAKNDSQEYRLILMCDVERPMFIVGRIINFFYKGLMRMTVVPNLPGDKRGLANQVFSFLSPLLKQSKELKKTNRKAYLLFKYSVNSLLLLVAAGLLFGLFTLVQYFIS